MTSVRDIQDMTAETFGVPPEEMTSRSHRWRVAHPRQVAMYLARRKTRHSLSRIGFFFGGRDHSTVHEAVERVQARIATNPELAAKVSELEARI
jgi:chromosomal replication initiator protein